MFRFNHRAFKSISLVSFSDHHDKNEKILLSSIFHLKGKSTFEKDENRIKSGAAKGYSPRARQNRWKELNSLEKR